MQRAEDARSALVRERERLAWQAGARRGRGDRSAATRWVLAAAAIGGAAGAALLATGSAWPGSSPCRGAPPGCLGVVIGTVLRAEHRAASAEQQRDHRELAAADARLRDAEHSARRRDRGARDRHEAAAVIDREWAAWKSAKACRRLSPEGVIDFFAGVDEARRRQQRHRQDRGRARRHSRDWSADWEKNARAVAALGTELGGERLAGRIEQLGATHAGAANCGTRGRPPQTLTSGAREDEPSRICAPSWPQASRPLGPTRKSASPASCATWAAHATQP